MHLRAAALQEAADVGLAFQTDWALVGSIGRFDFALPAISAARVAVLPNLGQHRNQPSAASFKPKVER